jgi:flagellar hook assembly protein FlgD
MPSRFALHGNVPNPFNPSTVIAYEIGAPGRVDIVIFDANGRRIRTLVSENRNTGSWTTQWDGRDESGQVVASGIYFCKMNAQGFESTQKMVLLK